MNPPRSPGYEIVFQKLDEALQEQGQLSGTGLPQMVQDCEEIQLLRESFEEQVDPPIFTYTRG